MEQPAVRGDTPDAPEWDTPDVPEERVPETPDEAAPGDGGEEPARIRPPGRRFLAAVPGRRLPAAALPGVPWGCR
ncbi:hypothetical protein ACIBI9_64235 [Nonomuraea sp. NPDC050451]|uniref:hypothetical protein n=1 Tax=Nonomuraea sp. NPDC050451 TaxID=3364364 RepID=UPI0037A6F1CE